MGLACRYDKIFRCLLLEHSPRGFHILGRIPPVPHRVEVPEFYMVARPRAYLSHPARDLARHKVRSAARRLMIKKNAVYDKHAVTFAVYARDIKRVQLGDSVRAFWFKRRLFVLRSVFFITAVKLRC